MKTYTIQNKEFLEEDAGFMRDIVSSSEGSRILSCIQCGTCSATCPVFEVMDYPPRQIFAMIREGEKHRVLMSITPWICASCYKCTVHCPAQINITEVMYKLKRMCIEEQIVARKTDTNQFYAIFINQVRTLGRTHELGLMLKYMLFRHPLELMKQVPRGINMMISGSLYLFPHHINNGKIFRKLTDHALMLDKA
jgi:heterodisulfide reductase subunit C